MLFTPHAAFSTLGIQGPQDKIQSELDAIAYGMELSPDSIQFSIGEAELFEPSGVELKPQAKIVLDKVGKVLTHFPGYAVISAHVEHTPEANIGNMGSAYEFTNARAVAVMSYLISHRYMSEDHLSPIGQGSQKPVSSNDQPEGQRRNRRIEFTLTQTKKI